MAKTRDCYMEDRHGNFITSLLLLLDFSTEFESKIIATVFRKAIYASLHHRSSVYSIALFLEAVLYMLSLYNFNFYDLSRSVFYC